MSSRAGALLELVDGAHERLATLVATFRDWSKPPASNEIVVERHSDAARVRWLGAGPFPQPVVTTRSFLLQRPRRLRGQAMLHGEVLGLGVRDGDQWWRWDRLDGASTGDASDVGLPPLLDPALLDPIRLLATLRFEANGTGVRSGREVQLARAWPRDQSGFRGGLSYELEFDSEHATMLRRAMFQDGRCVKETEALEVRYGCEIDPARFVFVSPDGQPPRRIDRPAAKQTAAAGSRLAVVGTVGANANGDCVAHDPVGCAGTVWLTGLSGAGKTTLAVAARRALIGQGRSACVLDGDALRQGLSSDLGLSPADRAEQARRVAHVAALLCRDGVVALVALVSPFADDRRRARAIHAELGLPFFEVWVNTPLAVCEQRDPKGLYARARAGELQGLTGIDAPYDIPQAPELQVSGYGEPPEAIAARIAALLNQASEPELGENSADAFP